MGGNLCSKSLSFHSFSRNRFAGKIEIQVRNLYRSSVINESDGQNLKAQLIGSYTDKLMEMIQDRWSASSQCSDLKKLGYSVEIIPIEVTLDENYILMTKELL